MATKLSAARLEPNRVWVTDVTYIRTHEDWLFLAAVIDLFSRQVVGWSMQPRMDRERIGRKVYNSREQARRDVFDSIEMFYSRSVATVTTTGVRR